MVLWTLPASSGVEVEDPLGQATCLATRDRHLEFLRAQAPLRLLDDLLAGQRPAGIDAWVEDAEQSDQRVDRRGSFGRHVITRGQQYPQTGPPALALAQVALLVRS